MSNNKFEEKSTDLNRRIILTEKEVSEISSLYEAAIQLSQQSSNSRNNKSSGQKNAIISLDDFNSSASVLQRKKAWHAVQECLERLGKKYNYDPEKFVINKLTRELEPYSQGM